MNLGKKGNEKLGWEANLLLCLAGNQKFMGLVLQGLVKGRYGLGWWGIEGLGMYKRRQSLYKCMQQIKQDFGFQIAAYSLT